MTTTGVKRQDLPPDPYQRLVVPDRTHVPARSESVHTISSTEPQRRMAVRVRGDGVLNQLIPDATSTAMTWQDEDFDTAGLHSTAALTSRIVIPTTGLVSGLWVFHAVIRWAGNAVGNRQVRFSRSGGDIGGIIEAPGNATDFSQELVRYVLDPTPGDYFEVFVFQNSGGGLNVLKTNAEDCYFEAIHIW